LESVRYSGDSRSEFWDKACSAAAYPPL